MIAKDIPLLETIDLLDTTSLQLRDKAADVLTLSRLMREQLRRLRADRLIAVAKERERCAAAVEAAFPEAAAIIRTLS